MGEDKAVRLRDTDVLRLAALETLADTEDEAFGAARGLTLRAVEAGVCGQLVSWCLSSVNQWEAPIGCAEKGATRARPRSRSDLEHLGSSSPQQSVATVFGQLLASARVTSQGTIWSPPRRNRQLRIEATSISPASFHSTLPAR